jgi:hypothetical protein
MMEIPLFVIKYFNLMGAFNLAYFLGNIIMLTNH